MYSKGATRWAQNARAAQILERKESKKLESILPLSVRNLKVLVADFVASRELNGEDSKETKQAADALVEWIKKEEPAIYKCLKK